MQFTLGCQIKPVGLLFLKKKATWDRKWPQWNTIVSKINVIYKRVHLIDCLLLNLTNGSYCIKISRIKWSKTYLFIILFIFHQMGQFKCAVIDLMRFSPLQLNYGAWHKPFPLSLYYIYFSITIFMSITELNFMKMGRLKLLLKLKFGEWWCVYMY